MGTPALTIVPPQPSEMTLPQLADAYGEANEKLDQLSIPYDKAAELRGALSKEIQSRYATFPAIGTFEAEGQSWLVQISRRRNEKTLRDPWACYKALKTNVREFVALIMGYVPQTFLVDQLGKEAADQMYDANPTGYRTLKPVRKAQADDVASAVAKPAA